MKISISEDTLARVSGIVSSRFGLHFTRKRWNSLERGIRNAMRELGTDNELEMIERIEHAPVESETADLLISCLTVGETFFFREKKTLDALEHTVLPAIFEKRKRGLRTLRIWSAGCATGEEPYTLAIILNRLLGGEDWHISLLATDLNKRFLRKAREGIYGEWSFRGTDSDFRSRYFTHVDNIWEINDSIKNMVDFSYLNLVHDPYPSLVTNTNAMDIIFIRNVLIYFDRPHVDAIVHRLHECLAQGGWLVVGMSELSHLTFSQFDSVHFPGTVLYRKQSAGSPVQKPVIRTSAGPVPETVRVDRKTEGEAPSFTGEKIPLEKTVTEGPELERALSFYLNHEYGEALRLMTEYTTEHPDDAEPMLLIARIYADTGNLDESLEWCTRGLALDRMDPGFHYLHAVLLHETDREEAALEELRRVLYLDPDFTLAHYIMGSINRKLGRESESRVNFRNAYALLNEMEEDEIVAYSDGVAAGRLRRIVGSVSSGGEE